jgi:putative transposase
MPPASRVFHVGGVDPQVRLAHAGKTQRRMVSAAIGTVFVQDSADAARTQWRSVADQLRGKFPKLGV